MRSPLISIVVPNYNQGQYLSKALTSIFNQSYRPLEVHVVDGGSSDCSIEVIKRFENRLASWRSEPDGGHYDAVNKGMGRATGEILCYLNSDDMLFDGALRCVAEVFVTYPEISWLTSLLPAAWDVHDNCVQVTRIPGYSREAFLDGMYGGEARDSSWFIQQELTFWRRELWCQAGSQISDKFSHGGDFDLWGRFFERDTLFGINTLLAGFRVRAGQRASAPIYKEETCQSLQDFRAKAGWSRFQSRYRARSLGIALGLFGTPKIGGALRWSMGYAGKRLVRSNPGFANCYWKIEEYRFP
jgi:glycosyltransferase involved in cell wall biosynthesis